MGIYVIYDFKFFAIEDDEQKTFIYVSAIHDEVGYHTIREKLSAQYNLSNLEPNIQVYEIDASGDRSITLSYLPQQGIPLADSYHKVLQHLHHLWGFSVKLEQVDEQGSRRLLATYPEQPSGSVATPQGIVI